jgi:hypothetical protein
MNRVVKISILLLLLISCKEENIISNYCNIINPISDLNWISVRIQELEQNSYTTSQYYYLTQAIFKNETIFVFGNCCPFCNSVSVVQSCTGQIIGVLGMDIDMNELNEAEVIWKHPDSTCTI